MWNHGENHQKIGGKMDGKWGISLKLPKLVEMGNESTRLHVETWDQTHGKLVNLAEHLFPYGSYELVVDLQQPYNVGPPSYLGWCRFAPATSSLFAYHKP